MKSVARCCYLYQASEQHEMKNPENVFHPNVATVILTRSPAPGTPKEPGGPPPPEFFWKMESISCILKYMQDWPADQSSPHTPALPKISSDLHRSHWPSGRVTKNPEIRINPEESDTCYTGHASADTYTQQISCGDGFLLLSDLIRDELHPARDVYCRWIMVFTAIWSLQIGIKNKNKNRPPDPLKFGKKDDHQLFFFLGLIWIAWSISTQRFLRNSGEMCSSVHNVGGVLFALHQFDCFQSFSECHLTASGLFFPVTSD